MQPDFWRGRRVFVTGHTGFKGAWLIMVLENLGAKVFGYALPPPTTPSLFDLLGLAARCSHQLGDIRDLDALTDALRASKADVVLHMAAQPLVRASYSIPIETYDVNVMGTAKLLEAVRIVGGVKSLVVITTDKCYENLGWAWGYRENDRLGGADPYSNSKACCELVVDAYRHSYFHSSRYPDHGVGLATARAGNVIGGGDFAQDRIIPDAVLAFMKGTALQIRYPDAVRPWQLVLEPLCGYLTLAERLYGDVGFAEGWNFGPDLSDSAPVSDLATRMAGFWGGQASWEHIGGEFLHEAFTLKLDTSKARDRMRWRPLLTLDRALQLTAEWYLAYRDAGDIDGVTKRQVEDYLTAVASPNSRSI